jgi:hypothetical protein
MQLEDVGVRERRELQHMRALGALAAKEGRLGLGIETDMRLRRQRGLGRVDFLGAGGDEDPVRIHAPERFERLDLLPRRNLQLLALPARLAGSARTANRAGIVHSAARGPLRAV